MIFNSLPVDAPLRITSRFGPRNTGIPGASTYHQGIDLGRDKNKPKTAILAVKEGTISANYWNKYRGWVVTIRHDATWTTLYQHLATQSPLVVGSRVAAGQAIGIMGNSSDPAVLKIATHLHFELRKNGTPVDPEPYLRDIQEEVLKEMTKEELEKLIDQRAKAIVKEVLTGDMSIPSKWAKDSWAKATTAGIVDGSRPKGYPTREQVAQMILNTRR